MKAKFPARAKAGKRFKYAMAAGVQGGCAVAKKMGGASVLNLCAALYERMVHGTHSASAAASTTALCIATFTSAFNCNVDAALLCGAFATGVRPAPLLRARSAAYINNKASSNKCSARNNSAHPCNAPNRSDHANVGPSIHRSVAPIMPTSSNAYGASLFSDVANMNEPNETANNVAAIIPARRENQRATTKYKSPVVMALMTHQIILALVNGVAMKPSQCNIHATPGVRNARSYSNGCPRFSFAAHCAHTGASPSYSRECGHAQSSECNKYINRSTSVSAVNRIAVITSWRESLLLFS